MINVFFKFLEICDWFLIDGVIGMNLFNMGLIFGDVLEIWNDEKFENIKKFYWLVVDVGFDIFLINFFGGNVFCLKLYDFVYCVCELNCKVVEIGCEVVDFVGCFVIVVGFVGLIGDIMELVGELIYVNVVEMFYE